MSIFTDMSLYRWHPSGKDCCTVTLGGVTPDSLFSALGLGGNRTSMRTDTEGNYRVHARTWLV